MGIFPQKLGYIYREYRVLLGKSQGICDCGACENPGSMFLPNGGGRENVDEDKIKALDQKWCNQGNDGYEISRHVGPNGVWHS